MSRYFCYKVPLCYQYNSETGYFKIVTILKFLKNNFFKSMDESINGKSNNGKLVHLQFKLISFNVQKLIALDRQ